MAPGGRPTTPTAQPLGLAPGPSDRGLGDGDDAASQDVVQAMRRDAALAAEANGSLPPGPSFDGPVSVVNSSCQFGGNTFYHGPVTVVLPDSRADADVVVADTSAPTAAAASTPASGEERAAAPTSQAAPKDGAKTSSVWRSLRPWQRVALLAGGLVLVLAVCLASTFFVVRAAREDADQVVTEPPAADTTPDHDGGGGGLVVARSGWGALPPRSTTLLRRPINRVIIHHTATAACSQTSLCKDAVRSVQIIHMYTNNWDDIGYNFLVGGDGLAYEGRGWDAQGAHTSGWNAVTLGVALIGNFCTASLPARQLDALVRLLQQGEARGALGPDYVLLGRCQMGGGGISPGSGAMKSIMELSRWNSSSVDTCTSC